ncbi:hypothetical protein RHSIM_Rhsim01G0114900 [Rhododendron simsii]|uniref:ATP-dependent DNA ligase family profile domain-containing protein n=1 Tax=Rhododendron simsii TaxID=118357 RepID=A0A834HG19_RHOSS|nr:hypothetical protein RHSIM_Rhsim01G0114900 [Rhododendron simsii]
MCDETKFSVVCSLFNWTQKAKSTAKKRSKLRKFLDTFCVRRGDYFGAVCLILPALDRHRGSYCLRESYVLTSIILDLRDEGIVLKDRGSKWEPGDRSGKWLKLKPEYVRAGSDLDVLIIGYYGSGRCGGEVAQFLVGLAKRSSPNTFPSRVATGLSDEELDAVVTKLKPFFSLLSSEVNVIRERTLHVVESQWLEDCFNKVYFAEIEADTFALLNEFPSKRSIILVNVTRLAWTVVNSRICHLLPPKTESRERAKLLQDVRALPGKDEIKERGRPTITSGHKRKISVIQPQRPWGRPRKSATVHENESVFQEEWHCGRE